jgi:hypothetical protein
MIGKLTGIQRLFGGEWVLSFTTKGDAGTIFDKLKDGDVNVEIKKYNPSRSKDANSFCWALCTDIGKAMTPPIPKEEVYRKAIKDVGEYEPLPIREDAVETFQRRWASHGTGWFAEVIDNSKIQGYKLVFAYYGSSTYDPAAMSRLLDYLVDESQQMGLVIPAKKEQEEMLAQWQARA